jgi:hypothetical protein
MALMDCPECKRQISSRVTVCPHCGFPVLSALEKDHANTQKAKGWVVNFLALPALLGSGWLQLLASKLGIELPEFGFGEAKSFGEVLILTAPLTLGIAFMVLALLRGWLASFYTIMAAGALVLAGTSYLGIHLVPWFGLDPDVLSVAASRAGLGGFTSYFSLENITKFLIWLLFGYWQSFGWWYFVSSFVVGGYIGWWLHKDMLRRWLDEV